jgi:transcriptional regulator with XRE-family HTH domain
MDTQIAQNDLKQFITDYIAEKQWSLRAYCRDTEKKLGEGNGIAVATLSFILRGGMRISPEIVRKIAQYHNLPVSKALQMAGYYESSANARDKGIAELIALREDARLLLARFDQVIGTLQ